MKRLTLPTMNDGVVLAQIAAAPRRELRHYPAEVQDIQQQYLRYIAVAGNASAVGAPSPLALPEGLKTLLRNYYTRHATFPELHEISTFLSQNAECCSMCGSLHPTTLDHIFPQAEFAEFAIFSRNLVPTCDCNRLRGVTMRGRRPGQRVLHPYFDDILTQRLVISVPTPVARSYASPRFKLRLRLPRMDPSSTTLRFHIKHGLRKTGVLDRHGRIWGRIALQPDIYLELPGGAVGSGDIDHAVTRKVAAADHAADTPNNWDSMFWFGINTSSGAKDYLLRRVRRLRAGQADRTVPDP